jgi:hypothetical protein
MNRDDSDDDDHELLRLALQIEKLMLRMSADEFDRFCLRAGIEDQEEFLAFLKRHVPMFQGELKRREH